MNPYQILQIQTTATQAQIKTAYRTLAKKYHPDINKAPSAVEMFRLLNSAFEQLSNKKNLPPPHVEEKRERKRSAAMAGLKLYEFVADGATSVTISCGYDQIPSDTVVFLMWMGQEYRVFLHGTRTTPFTVQLNRPSIRLTITE